MTVNREISQYGYVLGRFQPFHFGHLEYVEAAAGRCSCLVIGITNPDPKVLKHSASDLKRSQVSANPFSYFERMDMVRSALLDLEWPPESFMFVPSPIDDVSQIATYLPPVSKTICYITVYDEWGREKQLRLEELGYRTEVLWERSMDSRLCTSTYLRNALAGGEKWREYVPNSVVPYMEHLTIRLAQTTGTS